VKLFRISSGHEINVGLSVGRDASGLISLPFPDTAGSRVERVDGYPAPVATASELLVATAVRIVRERAFTERSRGDSHVLTSGGAGELDEAALTELSAARCVADVVSALRDGVDPSLDVRAWLLRYARTRLGPVRGPEHTLADRLGLRAFRQSARALRRARPTRSTALRAFRGPYRSLCEFRHSPLSPRYGMCVSASGLRSCPQELSEVVERLPASGEEDLFRKRTTKDVRDGQAHRCEAFMVARLRY